MSANLYDQLVVKKENKKRMTFTLDNKTSTEFKRICDAKDYNKSRIIENFMNEFLKMEASLIKQ